MDCINFCIAHRSSRDRAAHSRSSSADSNHSLKHLERERNELKDKLSMLPSYGLVHPVRNIYQNFKYSPSTYKVGYMMS